MPHPRIVGDIPNQELVIENVILVTTRTRATFERLQTAVRKVNKDFKLALEWRYDAARHTWRVSVNPDNREQAEMFVLAVRAEYIAKHQRRKRALATTAPSRTESA